MVLIVGCWAAALAVRAGAGEPWPWVGAMRHAGPEPRARAVLAEMRLDEKLAMLQGVRARGSSVFFFYRTTDPHKIGFGSVDRHRIFDFGIGGSA